jgi:hypothetical protein
MDFDGSNCDRCIAEVDWCIVKLKIPISTAVAIAVGLIVLLGYFLPIDILIGLRLALLDWAIIIASFALLVGVINLIYVHWKKTTAAQTNSVYSVVLLFSLAVTIIVVGWFGPSHDISKWIFNYVQVPIEASLMALLAVILAYASARLLRRRLNAFSIIFTVTVLIVLITATPLMGIELPFLSEFRSWVVRVPAVAGTRGILIGVALGIIATGLRILIGSDRPYRG